MFEAKMIDFSQMGDERGHLVVVEGEMDIPFSIQRMFYIYGTCPGVVRGQHANLKTEFVLINLVGSVKIKVDDGREKRIFVLEKPHQGVYLPRMYWKEMYDFSQDSMLLCLASEHYNASEYIRKYDEFLQLQEDRMRKNV